MKVRHKDITDNNQQFIDSAEVVSIETPIKKQKKKRVKLKYNIVSRPSSQTNRSKAMRQLMEIIEDGETSGPVSKRPLYSREEINSVDAMEKQTVDLLTTTSRQLLKEYEQQENELVDMLIGRTYSPRKPTKAKSDIDDLAKTMNIF